MLKCVYPQTEVDGLGCVDMCGTIAGLQCSGSQVCYMEYNYPDASGYCVDSCGFIGCDNGLECVDDESDDCNPDKGGADCAGFCLPSPSSRLVLFFLCR